MKYLRWIGWHIVYLFYWPREFHAVILKGGRLRKPWWKFKPHVHLYRVGEEQRPLYWRVWFADDMSYCRSHKLDCDVEISEHTGEIVGLKVYADSLTPSEATR